MKDFRKTLAWIFPFLRPEVPLYLVGLFAAAVIIILLVVVFWATFKEGLPNIQELFTNFTFENYIDVFSSPIMPRAALNTFILAVGTTIVAVLFGLPMTWLVHRTILPFKKLFVTLMLLHLVLPGFVRIMGWIMLLSPQVGMINELIRMVIPLETGPFSPYNIPFMIFLQGITFVPSVFLMLGGSFMAIDPSLEESAEASGMNKLQVFWRISLPLLRPAILAAAIYVFVTAASMFEIPALLGLPTQIHVFSTLMYEAIQPPQGLPVYGVAGVYAVMLLVPTLIALYFYQRMMKLSHRYATVTGKGYRPKLTGLGAWKWPALAFVVFYFLADMVLPYLSVLWISFIPHIQMPSIEAFKLVSFDGYVDGFLTLTSQGAIGNTIQLVLGVGILSMFIGLVMSWIILRTKVPGRFALDTIAMVPQVVPAIAFAFAVAFIGILLGKVVPLYGSIAAIVIADTVRRIPFTTRAINSSLIQIHPVLEEAVQTSGASKVVALRKIIIPLVAPALMYSFIWALLHAYREVTLALFLISPRNMVLSTVIWNLWTGSGSTDQAAAISVIMVAAMALFVLIVLKAFPKVSKSLQQH